MRAPVQFPVQFTVHVFSIVMLASTLASAAGFEKSTIQSGRYMGIGGAAVSSVSGVEALFFNPAGIIAGDKNQAVFNLSPTKVDFKAPAAKNDASDQSDRWGSPMALAYKHVISDQWAVAAGTYTAGGNITEYNNVAYTSVLTTDYSLKPHIYTKLAIQEFGVGVGYKASDKLRVGASWRAGMATIDQSLAGTNTANTILINQEYRNMTGWSMLGYRIGAQYDVNEKWTVGVAYRNAMHVAATGKLFVRVNTATGTNAESVEHEGMSVKTQLPQQFSLSSHYKCSDTWTTYYQYDWTNYGAVDRLLYEGRYTTSLTGTLPVSEQYVGWNDQHNLRIGSEYSGFSLPIRSAFVYTSRVSSNNFATSTLAPPGPGYTLSLGSGSKLMGDAMSIDGAIDYTMISGSVGSNESLNATTKAGSYTANVISLHMGATYNF